MFDKVYGYVKKWVTELCHILELIAAIFVFIAVVIALIALIPHVGELWENRSTAGAMLEFLKMLCRPTADNVLETIIFLVARHMIVVTTTTPLDDLISTISIVLLCFVRRYLKEHRMKDKMREEDWRRLEESDESGTAE